MSFLGVRRPEPPQRWDLHPAARLVRAHPRVYPVDGANPDTDYELTDISWRWDPISDFPLYPLNPLCIGQRRLRFLLFAQRLLTSADSANAELTSARPPRTERSYITIAAEHLAIAAAVL